MADCNEEATQLQQLMLSMILFIGEVYVELAGHTAAARSVVQDMQSSSGLLRSRTEMPGPRPQPWLATSLPNRRASSGSMSTQDAQWDGRSGTEGSSVDPYAMPQLPRPMNHAATTSGPLSPFTPTPPSRQQSPLPPGSSSNYTDVMSHLSHIESHPSPLSPSTPSPPPGHLARGLAGASMVRQPYPLRRAPSLASAGGLPKRNSPTSASPKPSSAAPAIAGIRRSSSASLSGDTLSSPAGHTSSPNAALAREEISRTPALNGVASLARPTMTLHHGSQRPHSFAAQGTGINAASELPQNQPPQQEQRNTNPHQTHVLAVLPVFVQRQHTNTHPPSNSSQSTAAVWSLPIPRAVDLVSGMGLSGPGSYTSSDGPTPLTAGLASLQPASLPPAFKRAVAMYQEAVAASKVIFTEGLEAGARAGELQGSTPASHSLQQRVADCGDGYVAKLNAHYSTGQQQQQRQVFTGSKAAQGADFDRSCSGNREDQQTLLAAIVAAQTWLMQALTELGTAGGISSGVTPADVARLLKDVSAAQLRLRLSSTSLQPQQQLHPTQTLSAQLPCSEATDDVKAAERWRNRFLRTLLDRNSQPASEGPHTAAFATTMLRPVGLWLPAACWNHLSETSPSAPNTSPSPHNAAPSSRPASSHTWQQALPTGNSVGFPTRADASDTDGSSRCAPLPARLLLCTSPQAAAAHARAQLQLQWHLCQLAWEGGPAACLVPTQQDCAQLSIPAPTQLSFATECNFAESQPDSGSGRRAVLVSRLRSESGRQQQQQQQQQEEGQSKAALRVERWLARCRMAHMLLVKGAWNKHCCVAQVVDGDVAATEGRQ